MSTYLSIEQGTVSKGNTFEEESNLLRDLFNDPTLDVEVYISERLKETTICFFV